MDTTCNHALYAMTDVFNEFFLQLAPILLPDVLAQFRSVLLPFLMKTRYLALLCYLKSFAMPPNCVALLDHHYVYMP